MGLNYQFYDVIAMKKKVVRNFHVIKIQIMSSYVFLYDVYLKIIKTKN